MQSSHGHLQTSPYLSLHVLPEYSLKKSYNVDKSYDIRSTFCNSAGETGRAGDAVKTWKRGS